MNEIDKKAEVSLFSCVDEGLRLLRWTVRRWSFRHCWYRMRLPFRRRRWMTRNILAAQRIPEKRPVAWTAGPAIAFGEFSGSSGLGRGAGYDLEQIKKHHEIVIAVDVSEALKGRPTPIDVPHKIENAYFLCQPDTYWVIPELVAPQTFENAYRIGRWAWETPYFPDSWRFSERLLHEVWASSEFCATTFRSALAIPVKVSPYPVPQPTATSLDMRSRLSIKKDAFLGVAVMDIFSCPDRKNPWAHVKAWKKAFGDDPDCVLVMKLRVSRRTRLVVNELMELAGAGNNVRFLLDELTEEEIAGLHRSADVYMSLHRSEGFGLNIMEALLLDKPVIATHYSANTEFGPSFPNYIGISYSLKDYDDWLAHYDKSFQYADPDLDEAAARLREVCGSRLFRGRLHSQM